MQLPNIFRDNNTICNHVNRFNFLYYIINVPQHCSNDVFYLLHSIIILFSPFSLLVLMDGFDCVNGGKSLVRVTPNMSLIEAPPFPCMYVMAPGASNRDNTVVQYINLNLVPYIHILLSSGQMLELAISTKAPISTVSPTTRCIGIINP